jgi:phosphate starvation-inducible PhoH-like protein
MKRTGTKSNSRVDRNDRNQFLQQTTHDRLAQEQYEFERANPKRRNVDLIPRNMTQEKYIKALNDDKQSIVFAMGPAGTGKTLLATQYAIRQLKAGVISKIIISRPAVSVDEQHGFLPGTLVEKLAPWVIPIMDVFKEYYRPHQIEAMLAEEQIEIAPLAYMRGRNLKDCVVILDESQNCTPSQVKMVLTRISQGCKMIVTGDINQHDRGFDKNGLKDFTDRLAASDGVDGITVIKFANGDIERHPIVAAVLDLYGDDVK